VGGHCYARLLYTQENPGTHVYRRLGGPQGCCEWVQKTLPLWGFISQTVQPVASCCINYAILAHNEIWCKYNLKTQQVQITNGQTLRTSAECSWLMQ
jgi:hypothetical protein